MLTLLTTTCVLFPVACVAGLSAYAGPGHRYHSTGQKPSTAVYHRLGSSILGAGRGQTRLLHPLSQTSVISDKHENKHVIYLEAF